MGKTVSNSKFQRGSSYRSAYIEAHPPYLGKYYICSYCGKIVRTEDMQVDHVVSIKLANKNWFYRLFVPREGINSKKNLTSACANCNQAKGQKGGEWIVRGRVGYIWHRIAWFLFAICFVVVMWNILLGKLTPVDIRNYVSNTADSIKSNIAAWISSVSDSLVSAIEGGKR